MVVVRNERWDNAEIQTLERKTNTTDNMMNWLVKEHRKLDENEAKREHVIQLQNNGLKIEQKNQRRWWLRLKTGRGQRKRWRK